MKKSDKKTKTIGPITDKETELQKGALYLIDDNFRKRMAATVTAMATATVTCSFSGLGSKWTKNYQPYENGIVILGEVENNGNDNREYDICKVMFNNKSGLRYLYRFELELAERVDKK